LRDSGRVCRAENITKHPPSRIGGTVRDVVYVARCAFVSRNLKPRITHPLVDASLLARAALVTLDGR
jgi:hypothetical protein